jgi:hypothetical protein
MMKTRNFSLIVLVFLALIPVQGQTKVNTRELFNEGEMYILFEEYNEAIGNYLNLLSQFPDNANIKYRIGQCYLNMPGEKEKAIPYLEDAVKSISPRHKAGRLKEESAPFDALYYLANAYRVNNQIDKAIETYNRFIENMDHKIYDSTIVRFQLQTCHNAKQMMATPLYVKYSNLGDLINDRFSESNPVVISSDNGLLFSRRLQLRTALFHTKLTDGRWSAPVDIIPDLNVDDKFYPTALSKDGKTLYLYSNFDFIGNIYTSKYENDRWNPVVKLNENINTKYWESHATISPDGKKLFFSSNRKGGYGGLDIYMSELDSIGQWGMARNLGPVINTPYHEDTPAMTEDGKTLFFSSRGHYNMGGYDIFYSTMLGDGEWSIPLNAGYPLNTTDDDLFFTPVQKGYQGYIARYDEKGFGEQDLFRVEIFSDDHPRKFLIRGVTRIDDLRSDIAAGIRVIVRDLNGTQAPIIVYTNPATGAYEFEVKHGDYEITFDADGAVKEVKRLTLPLTHNTDSITMPLTSLEKSDFEAELSVLSDSLIRVRNSDTVEIKLLTETQSILDIIVSNAGKLIVSEKHKISDPSFVFRFLPLEGRNVVDFRLTDKFSNVTAARVIVEKRTVRQAVTETITRPEYTRVIAERQVEAFLDILKKNADNDIRKIISDIDVKKHKFENIDNVVTLIKERAVAAGIDPERIDRLALKTAVQDNILTQAAVDYLGRNSDGEVASILKSLNIYDLKLRSWSDLKEYITSESEGRITGNQLDSLAKYLLTGPDPSIGIIKEKIVVYAATTENETAFKEAISSADSSKHGDAGLWLEAFVSAITSEGITASELSDLFSAITFIPGTTIADALTQLSGNSPAELSVYLSNIDTKTIRGKDISSLMDVLLADRSVQFNESEFYTAMAATIAENNLSGDLISQNIGTKNRLPGILLGAAGLSILIILILFLRRKKKNKK